MDTIFPHTVDAGVVLCAHLLGFVADHDHRFSVEGLESIDKECFHLLFTLTVDGDVPAQIQDGLRIHECSMAAFAAGAGFRLHRNSA